MQYTPKFVYFKKWVFMRPEEQFFMNTTANEVVVSMQRLKCDSPWAMGLRDTEATPVVFGGQCGARYLTAIELPFPPTLNLKQIMLLLVLGDSIFFFL